MLPTLKPGQVVWVWHWFTPKVGNVVVFKYNAQEFVKRVKQVNGQQIFLLGDNPNDSLDSRQLGLIKRENVIGKVLISGSAPI